MKRHCDPCHGADFTRPHAACIDHIICLNRPLICHHAADPAIILVNIGDLDTLDDLDPVIASSLGKRLGDIDRIGLAILWQPNAADRILNIQVRITGTDF